MKDKALSHAQKLNDQVCKSQGGSFQGQGPNSIGGKGGIKEDSTSSPHTSHDNAVWQQGGKGRKVKSIGSE